MCVQTTIAKHKERQDMLDYYRHVMRNDKLAGDGHYMRIFQWKIIGNTKKKMD